MKVYSEYLDGDPCPFCDAECDDFYSHTEGAGSHSDLRIFYDCNDCESSWVTRLTQVLVAEETKQLNKERK